MEKKRIYLSHWNFLTSIETRKVLDFVIKSLVSSMFRFVVLVLGLMLYLIFQFLLLLNLHPIYCSFTQRKEKANPEVSCKISIKNKILKTQHLWRKTAQKKRMTWITYLTGSFGIKSSQELINSRKKSKSTVHVKKTCDSCKYVGQKDVNVMIVDSF